MNWKYLQKTLHGFVPMMIPDPHSQMEYVGNNDNDDKRELPIPSSCNHDKWEIIEESWGSWTQKCTKCNTYICGDNGMKFFLYTGTIMVASLGLMLLRVILSGVPCR